MHQFFGGISNQAAFPSHRKVGKSCEVIKDNLASVVFSESPGINYSSRFVEEEKRKRDLESVKKQERIIKRREAKVLQEAGRVQAAEDDYQRSINKINIQRSLWRLGQRNYPSEAFNLITLNYDNTEQGESLRHQDDSKRRREAVRSFNLYTKMNSGFNVINGSRRLSPSIQSFY